MPFQPEYLARHEWYYKNKTSAISDQTNHRKRLELAGLCHPSFFCNVSFLTADPIKTLLGCETDKSERPGVNKVETCGGNTRQGNVEAAHFLVSHARSGEKFCCGTKFSPCKMLHEIQLVLNSFIIKQGQNSLNFHCYIAGVFPATARPFIG